MLIETARLLIRPPKLEDLPTSNAIWTDPAVKKLAGGEPATEEQATEGFMEDLSRAESDYGFKSVIEKASGRHIGDCGLIQKEIDAQQEVELVYFFTPSAWGQGFATEAASRLLEYATDSMDLARVVAIIDPENAASIRVAQKVGMQREKSLLRAPGILKELYVFSGV